MGMTEHHLLADAVHHVVHGEVALFGLDLGVEHHLQQHVAQLLAHIHRIFPVDGVQGLIRLLQEIPADGGVGLLGVPGAAPRSTQKPHDLQEVLPVIAALTLKIYHTLPAFAS